MFHFINICFIPSRLKMWLFIIAACLSQGAFSSEKFTSAEPPEGYTVDRECFLNVSEIISYHGYPSEEHHIETEDKYILTVNRIPHGKYNCWDKGPRPIVFLQHAILGDATHWLSNLPNNSFGFILADAGYDVWLGNSRGNTWSSRHKTLKPTELKFWEFSSHEMGYYDIPAVIYYILNETGHEQLYYVGHSEGSATGFIAFSTWPKLAEKVKLFFALGPVSTISSAKTPIAKLGNLPKLMIQVLFGTKQVLHSPPYLRKLFVKICNHLPGFCARTISYICGSNIPNWNLSRMDMYVAHSPAGTSLQNLLHWRQMFFEKQFKAYDYGSQEQNMQKYNQATPPVYKIEDIKIPIELWTAGCDLFINLEDVAVLRHRISNLVGEHHIPEWHHLDFIWGLDATERMYMKIIETMKKYA
ncbi:lysosomal acid lipase/cholesteryl ester hydrolase-like [Heteronotia binoei]|uniref:lysosomal acid lipase/cholesteryl ester hydrolase-like n=1 Tax=Heteronotia binoei TaxID=13085 RepID=UPI002930C784|nr:lysosomal acid lipase/cholesteryl ester hydrolase-like [Heteronotia binoei]